MSNYNNYRIGNLLFAKVCKLFSFAVTKIRAASTNVPSVMAAKLILESGLRPEGVSTFKFQDLG